MNDDAVQQISELLNAAYADEREGGDSPPDEPQTAADIVGDIAGGRQDDDVQDPGTVAEQAEGGQETDAEVDSGEPGDEPSPVTVADIAQKLGVDASDIYNELEIPLGEDESITLGEFKDRVKDLQDVDAQRVEVEDKRNELEKANLAQQAELQHILSMVPAEMRQQMLEVAGQRHHDYVEAQSQAVLEAIPAWKDADNRLRDRDAIVKLGNEYGFSDVEMTHTHDARTLKLVHDFVRLRERLNGVDLQGKRDAKARAGKPLKKGSRRSNGTLRKAIDRAHATGDSRDQVSAVSQLIRSQ